MPDSNVVPLYQQIKEDIKAAIERGKYKPNEKIPAEPELSAEYSVSRITVRGACGRWRSCATKGIWSRCRAGGPSSARRGSTAR